MDFAKDVRSGTNAPPQLFGWPSPKADPELNEDDRTRPTTSGVGPNGKDASRWIDQNVATRLLSAHDNSVANPEGRLPWPQEFIKSEPANTSDVATRLRLTEFGLPVVLLFIVAGHKPDHPNWSLARISSSSSARPWSAPDTPRWPIDRHQPPCLLEANDIAPQGADEAAAASNHIRFIRLQRRFDQLAFGGCRYIARTDDRDSAQNEYLGVKSRSRVNLDSPRNVSDDLFRVRQAGPRRGWIAPCNEEIARTQPEALTCSVPHKWHSHQPRSRLCTECADSAPKVLDSKLCRHAQ